MIKPKLLIYPGGGYGDMICSLPVLDFFIKHFGELSDIDVGNCKNASVVSSILGYERTKKIKTLFTGTGRVDIYNGFVQIEEIPLLQFRQDLLDLVPDFIPYAKLWSQRTAEFGKAVQNQPFLNNHICSLAIKKDLTRWTLPQWCMGMEQLMQPKLEHPSVLEKIAIRKRFNLPEKFITINDGWNITGKGMRPTKAYPVESWIELIRMAQNEDIYIVQIGSTETGESLPVDLNLRGIASFEDALTILSLSRCHIDIEGGLVHAATALGTKCIVLFGPTSSEFFGYPQNYNLTHGACSNCYWLKPEWAMTCISSKSNICMKHNPSSIMRLIKTVIGEKV